MASLKNLEALSLDSLDTDVDLNLLSGFTQLSGLSLSGNNLKNPEVLFGLKGLEHIWLDEGSLEEKVIHKLRQETGAQIIIESD